MNKENNPEHSEEPYSGKAYAYIAVGLTAAGAVALGLAFTVLGIYSLIASVIFHLASLCFINVQKRKNNFRRLAAIRITVYVLLAITLAVFIGGIIYSLK